MRKLTKEERQRNIEIVQEGRSTDYWKLIEEKLKAMIAVEERYLDSFKSNGITAEGVTKYNLACEKIANLKQFLRINDAIIGDNQTIMDQAEDIAKKAYRRTESFVNGTVWK